MSPPSRSLVRRRIGTTRFGCGCTVHVEPDVNGIAPWLEHCALHGAAESLLMALREIQAGDLTDAQRATVDHAIRTTTAASPGLAAMVPVCSEAEVEAIRRAAVESGLLPDRANLP